MKEIIEYLKERYCPLAIVVYGSYADGSNNSNSDFDALVITDGNEKCHDTSIQNGIRLDVFVYPVSTYSGDYDHDEFVQIADGIIVLDTNACAAKIIQREKDYITEKRKKTSEEIRDELGWCRKMLSRAVRQDAEGLFRLHWLLIDSLEIYCDAISNFYRGPKKSLIWMKKNDFEAYSCYYKALSECDIATCEQWINLIDARFSK